MSNPCFSLSCKHGTPCYFDKNNDFIACKRCYEKGRLTELRQVLFQNRVKSANMDSPFAKSSLISRSPTSTPPPGGAGVSQKTSENNEEQLKSDEVMSVDLPIKAGQETESIIEKAEKVVQQQIQLENHITAAMQIKNLKQTLGEVTSALKNMHGEHEKKVSDLMSRVMALEAQKGEIKNGNKPEVADSDDSENSVVHIPNNEGVMVEHGNEDTRPKEYRKLVPKPNKVPIKNKFQVLQQSDEEQGTITQPKKRKRKDTGSPTGSPSTQAEEISGTDKPNVSNKTPKEKTKEKKPLPPPPIKVAEVNDFNKLQPLIKEAIEDEKFWSMKSLGNDVWKINPQNDEAYQKISEKLNEKGFLWWTYDNKNTRPLKVIVKGLHPTTPREKIIENLSSQGFKVLDVSNIMKDKFENGAKLGKAPLPIHLLTFERGQEVEKVYEIKKIMATVVKIEPLKVKSKLIVQCRRCQMYLHTQRFCHREPKCVKCSKGHLTKDCKFKRIINPKCINCGGPHTANYRKCEVAVKLQELHDRNLRGKGADVGERGQYKPQFTQTRKKQEAVGKESQIKSRAEEAIQSQPRNEVKSKADSRGQAQSLRSNWPALPRQHPPTRPEVTYARAANGSFFKQPYEEISNQELYTLMLEVFSKVSELADDTIKLKNRVDSLEKAQIKVSSKKK